MGIPLDVAVDVFQVLEKHGVKSIRHEDMNAVIAALTPCFEPGYPHPVTPSPKDEIDDRFAGEETIE